MLKFHGLNMFWTMGFGSLPATLTFAQTRDCDITEQYVDWDNSINFIFMMDQNLPPLQNNILIGEKTSTLFS